MPDDYSHRSVLCKEILENIVLKESGIFVDCTIGCGGHSRLILEKFPTVRVIGIDCDTDAIGCAEKVLEGYKDRVTFVHDNFRNLRNILNKLGIENIGGCLFDLGLSSLQIEKEERGFSFRKEGPLDMRMDRTGPVPTASYLVNRLDEQRLFEIIRDFGEDRLARKIARRIVQERRKKEISTTKDLADIVLRAYRRYSRIHPATRTFQALRIAVNDELNALKEGLVTAISFLASGGMVFAISFHSLEDRIIKNVFNDYKRNNLLNVVTKKPFRAADTEIFENPRSRSAKLRIGQKI